MMTKAIFVSLLAALAASVAVGWRLSLRVGQSALAGWRRRLLLAGLVANAASLVALLTAPFLPTLVSARHYIQVYRIFFLLAPASVPLGAFGKRAPRVLVVLNGLVLTWFWLALGASIL